MNVDKVWDPVYAPDYSPNLYILAIGGPHQNIDSHLKGARRKEERSPCDLE